MDGACGSSSGACGRWPRWDTWKGEGGGVVNSCAIITTEANALVRPAHDRMPAIIDPDYYGAWLDRRETDAGQLRKLLAPYQASLMASHPVSKQVGDVRKDDETCPAPLNLSLPI